MRILEHWFKDYNLLIFEEIDSTSEEAKRLARSEIAGEFVVVARSQTAGRGRYGKDWDSPYGNLYVSILLKPEISIDKIHEFVFVSCVALGEALKYIFPLDNMDIKYKWPNDIYLNGKKLAGILLESSLNASKNSPDWVVIGVGLNINSFPDLNNKATSLVAEGYNDVTSDLLLDRFMTSFKAWKILWENKGFAYVREAWLEKAYALGGEISFHKQGKLILGIFEGLDLEGNIKLRDKDGNTHIISSGEVFVNKVVAL
jgi:BirA family biotin operon repressor/biotin-[acetyl-CoA-carboxylase] ligase